MDEHESVYDGIREVNALVGEFEDIHICGACRAEFNNLDEFLNHKQRCKLLQRIQKARACRRLKTQCKTTEHKSSHVKSSVRESDVHIKSCNETDTTVLPQTVNTSGGIPCAVSSSEATPTSSNCAQPQYSTDVQMTDTRQIHLQIIKSTPGSSIDTQLTDHERVLNVGLNTGTGEHHTIQLDLHLPAEQLPIHEGPVTVQKPSKVHRCSYIGCTYSTGRSGDLSRHIKTHSGPVTSFPCTVCGKTFSRVDSLKRHLAQHDNKKVYQCDFCSYAARDTSTLKRHIMRIHRHAQKQFKCSDCSSMFHERSKLAIHKRSHTNERPYQCHICSKRFLSLSDLSRHERVHSDEKPYKCGKCQFATKIKHNLTVHVRSHHAPSYNPLYCDQCDFITPSKQYLQQHRLHHEPQLSQKCSICSKSVRKSSMYLHMQSHRGLNFKCDLCEFKSKYKHGLSQHLQKIHGLVTEVSKSERAILPDGPVPS